VIGGKEEFMARQLHLFHDELVGVTFGALRGAQTHSDVGA
jgi:hypothetical protein